MLRKLFDVLLGTYYRYFIVLAEGSFGRRREVERAVSVSQAYHVYVEFFTKLKVDKILADPVLRYLNFSDVVAVEIYKIGEIVF